MAVGATCLLITDQIISGLLIGPLTIFFWRGTWTLMDVAEFDPRYSFIIGITGLVISAFIQHLLTRYLRYENTILWHVTSRVYSYVMGVVCVNVWRGTWGTADIYTDITPLSHSISLFAGYGTLLLLRATRNTQSPPPLVELDTYEPAFFNFSTRFKQDRKVNREHYILDVLFTCLVIHPGMVLSWRGIWGLLDNFLYPEDYEMTTWVTLFIAYALFLALFPLQLACDVWYRNSAARTDTRGWWGKVLSQQLLTAVGAVCSVCMWRGVWFALDVYLWPEDLMNSSWLTHGVGFAALTLMLSSNSVVEKGCYVDGEGDKMGGCRLQNGYLRLLIPHFKGKSSHQEAALVRASSPDTEAGTDNVLSFTLDEEEERSDSQNKYI